MLRGYPIDGVTAGNDFSKTCCVLELIADAVPCWSLFAEEFSLSAKELRTIQGLYNGGSLQEVAEQHSLSFNTVKSQLLAVYRKMGIKNQRQLMMALTKYT
nr:LuxR C-terminal-related transcriptional regulator [Rheinheimera maricola]